MRSFIQIVASIKPSSATVTFLVTAPAFDLEFYVRTDFKS